MSEEDVLLKIHNKIYEGKLRAQHANKQVPDSVQPMRRPLLPEPYGEMVSATDMGSYWEIKLRTFLRTEDFAEIARLVKRAGGEYVSAGKASHFIIPR